MSIFKRSKPKPTNRLPMTGDVRRGFKFYCAMCVMLVMLCSLAMPVFASETTNDPLTVINNLSDFVFGLIRAVGMITLGFGICWPPCWAVCYLPCSLVLLRTS